MLEHFFAELDLAQDSEKLALISLQEKITFKTLMLRLNAACQILLGNQFHQGLTAIILPNTVQTCILILACLKAKACFVSIDNETPKNELVKIIKQLRPSQIITDHNLYDLGVPQFSPNFFDSGKDKQQRTLYPDKDEAFVTLTSGSTGVVKAVVHTNYSLCEAITHVLVTLKLEQNHRLLCTISHPSNAFLRNLLACLIKKSTFILGYNQQFSNILKLIDVYAPTHVRFSIKDLIALAKSTTSSSNFDLIKRCDYSGDVVPIEVINNVNSKLRKTTLITSYAMSECGTIAYNELTRIKSHQILTGKIINTVNGRLINNNGEFAATGEIGELQIKTSTLFKLYLHDKEETMKAFDNEGWFKTGDLFTQSEDGWLEFHGRKKNIIISNGKNINPEYIRSIINQWQEIEDCIVTSEPSAEMLNRPVVFCLLKKSNLNISSFREYLINNLSQICLPKNIYVLPQFPRTIFGKIDIASIRQKKQEYIQQVILHVVFD